MSWLPDPVEDLFGADATAEEAYDLLTVDVPAASWTEALRTARTTLGCTYFDWLSAVDEPELGFRVCAHVAAVAPGSVRRLLLRTTVPHAAPVLASAVGEYAGAAWHERETHEMFGIGFDGHPHLVPLLLPDTFEGHPLRKDFVLAARVAKAWPGAKEPGESEHGGPKRRQMLPPGVPDPNEWGPLKGQLPAAPARPARGVRPARGAGPGRGAGPVQGAGAAGGAGAGAAGAGAAGAGTGPGERPARRSRSASEGSASQSVAPAAAEAAAPPATDAPGSQARPARPARRARSVSEGSASQRPAAGDGPAATGAPAAPRSSDAPWHHAKPAFDEPDPAGSGSDGSDSTGSDSTGSDSTGSGPDGASGRKPGGGGTGGADTGGADTGGADTGRGDAEPGPARTGPEPTDPAPDSDGDSDDTTTTTEGGPQ
ncbi:NADH-quinone oxidoreductase subunit C [Streptomyces sp. NPDC049813]|uniref:NADH-quinone oxidoreductase subunit C n=1 Tax=Streptomyces sp. NPDC049813 TaxID=3365597 RepID=UPI0037A25590